MSRDAPTDYRERRHPSEPAMHRPSRARSRSQALPLRRARAVEDDDDEDPDLSFLDELRDPEGPPHSFDDPETREVQRDREHELETTLGDDEDEELPPGRRAGAGCRRPAAKGRAAR